MITIRHNTLLMALTACMVLFLTSCDPGSKIEYVVKNKTTKPLNITFQFPGSVHVNDIVIDVDSTKLIHSENQLGYADFINETKDSIYLYNFVVKQGNIVSEKNFKDKKNWTFNKSNPVKASYTLTIDKSYFAR